MNIRTPNGIMNKYIGFFNQQYNLSAILQMGLQAQSFLNATAIFYRHLAPILSHWSYVYDAPITIKKFFITEVSTQSKRYFFLSDGQTKQLLNSDNSSDFKDTIRSLFALYREALNAVNTPLYQLFCFYKIIEGFYSMRSSRPIIKLNEIMPANFIHAGKKFTWVKKYVNDNFRTSFAHFNLQSGNLIQSPDEFDYISAVLDIIPECKYIAHEMISALHELK